MKRRLLLAAASTAAILCSYAQINSPSADGYLDRAMMMYDDGNYYGCIDQLINIDEDSLAPEMLRLVRYYRALATLHTDKALASRLLQEYIAMYPEASDINDARLAYGDCYYGSDYAKALNIYNKVYVQALGEVRRDELTYRKSFCYLMARDYAEALSGFESLSVSPEYANASLFYRGYIAYAQGQYAKAEELFREVDTSTAPGYMSEYYLSQIYYMRGDYRQALAMAKNLLKRNDVADAYAAEANRIVGESSYQIGEDSQAVKYLQRYVSMVEAPLPSALYILGLNAYNAGDYTQAVDYLSKATSSEDAMGQCAYLYLGQSYMHQSDFTAAAMAFNRALNMDYDADVRETAYYNYAVASLNGGKVPFASTVKTFSDFLRLYPQSRYAPEVQEYIITSYLTDNNYAAALASINEMTDPSTETMAAKQRILYVLGNQALAKGDCETALAYLTEAASLSGYDKDVAKEVDLAAGEAYYRMGDNDKAVSLFRGYLSAPAATQNVSLAYYDLGYALFAQKKYGDAATEFGNCVKSPGVLSSSVVADAYNRLGDCYYWDKDFAAAEGAYDKAYEINPASGDYSLYQRALMSGYQRKHSQKVEMLAELQRKFPSSALIPDAMLETTESYIQLGKTDEAIDVYRRLVEAYPNTAQARQGYLQMALVKLNRGDRDGAITDYREVIRRYPTSDEARQAVEQMKRISASAGTLTEFKDFLLTVTNAPQMDESEIEQLTFEEAERQYLTEGKMYKLEDFVESYPESNQRARALSYLVDGLYKKGEPQGAYEYACALAEQYPSSSYLEPALIVKAKVEESDGKGNLAMRTWQQLAAAASAPSTLLTARMGIIRNGREANALQDVLQAADAVIASAGVGADDMDEAIYSRGYVLDAQGDSAGARNAWSQIADHVDTVYGLQAAYQLGESYYEAKDYRQAETWAKKVANADSPYAYWIARGFILLSDVYAAQGDKYKARQYLEALRDNYTGSEKDIFNMIDQRLK